MKTTFRKITRRSPQDAVCALNDMKVYPEKVYTTSMVTRSMSVVRISGASDVSVEHYKKFVKSVFTQNEKTTLVDGGHKNMLTIHEYQGNEAEKVVLVRLTVSNDFYEKTNYMLTGITR